MSAWDCPTAANASSNSNDGPVVIPGSRRPDGSWRKEVRVRPGYVPPDETPKFVSPGTKYERERAQMGIVGLVKSEEKKTPTASQKKNIPGKKNQNQNQNQNQKEKNPQNSGQKQATSHQPPPKQSTQPNKEQPAPPPQKADPAPEARAKGLKKKIRQIDQLIEKQKNGEKLNKEQLEKINRLEELQNELSALQIQNE
jgi:partner of Y14 and mago